MRAPMTEPSLKNKTILSLFWSFIDKFGQQLLNFLSMLILMNIVATEDYGKIGSLALFIALIILLLSNLTSLPSRFNTYSKIIASYKIALYIVY